ncbi:GldG family protein [Myxococcota bacterium]|nr:GldG family protein [Myxococcota bacterium]
MNQQLRRRLAYGSNATLVTAMVLGVLVLLYVLADGSRARWDLSADAANTLQADTEAKLTLLDADGLPVEITAFSHQRGKEDSALRDRAVRDLLVELDTRSTSLSWRIVDFDKERLTAERLGVNDYGRIVVQRGQDRVDIKDRDLFRRVGKGDDRGLEFLGEAALSRAFAQLLAPTRRVVYVLQGHGEPSPTERGPGGLSDLVAALDIERYDVEPLDLLRTDREGNAPVVPEDAAVVVVAGLRGPLTAQEEDVLLEYLGRGGPLLLALDAGQPLPVFLPRLGVRIPDGLAMDTVLVFPYKDRPVPVYKSHPITETLREGKVVTMLGAPAPLRLVEPAPAGLRVDPILVGGRESWIERGGESVGGSAVFQAGVDGEGPTVLATAVQLLPGGGVVRPTKPAARVLVLGDSEALTNGLLAEGPGNKDLALNAVHWLAGDDQRLGATKGRRTAERRLALTLEETDRLRWISLLLLPGLVSILGLATWNSRRGR